MSVGRAEIGIEPSGRACLWSHRLNGQLSATERVGRPAPVAVKNHSQELEAEDLLQRRKNQSGQGGDRDNLQ
jgi:hypothetical protein